MSNFTKEQAGIIRQAISEYNSKVENMDRSGTLVFAMVDSAQKVVCVLKVPLNGNPSFGIARCSPEDRFVAPIGKILALDRAGGKRPRQDYLHFFCGGDAQCAK
ncbi:MAG: hypothetical protein P4N41_06400 [Negativicutes bacterium]|nr:hypothetical protein [Negativicutes bacterium]